MEIERPSAAAVLGIVLIIVGGAYLAARLAGVDLAVIGWPAFVIVPGLVLFGLAVVVGGAGGAGLATVGSVVATTGVILAVQRATGLWATWAYAWAIVAPGSVGLGLVVYGLLTRQPALARSGLWPAAAGVVLFLVGLLFFEGFIGLSGQRLVGLDVVAALLLIVFGGVIIVRGLRAGREGD